MSRIPLERDIEIIRLAVVVALHSDNKISLTVLTPVRWTNDKRRGRFKSGPSIRCELLVIILFDFIEVVLRFVIGKKVNQVTLKHDLVAVGPARG